MFSAQTQTRCHCHPPLLTQPSCPHSGQTVNATAAALPTHPPCSRPQRLPQQPRSRPHTLQLWLPTGDSRHPRAQAPENAVTRRAARSPTSPGPAALAPHGPIGPPHLQTNFRGGGGWWRQSRARRRRTPGASAFQRCPHGPPCRLDSRAHRGLPSRHREKERGSLSQHLPAQLAADGGQLSWGARRRAAAGQWRGA